jgi:hypothetical protein
MISFFEWASLHRVHAVPVAAAVREYVETMHHAGQLEARPVAVHAPNLQPYIDAIDTELDRVRAQLRAAGFEVREDDPADNEALIAAFMAESEGQRRAERLECGIVDAEVLTDDREA